MKVYISPSTQEHNAYAGGGNEEAQMRAICVRAVAVLTAAGHTVKMGGTESALANATEANAWGARKYVAVHSNAGGGEGTEAWYYTGSDASKKLAQAVYDRVRKVSAAPDRGLKATTALIEVARPKAPATIIEIAFHDDKSDAEEIRTHHAEYGNAIAQGVLDVIGTVQPKEQPMTDTVLTVCVQPAKLAALTAYLKANGIYATATEWQNGRPVVVAVNPVPLRVKG